MMKLSILFLNSTSTKSRRTAQQVLYLFILIPVDTSDLRAGKLLAAVVDFPKAVTIALAHIIKHLTAFGLADVLLEAKLFDKFSSRVHMLLGANTLTNLELYRNETDYSVKGSLLWVLDNTRTKFGARMLKQWIARPLVDKQ
jgi:DNA mismatch repair protein MSH3